MLSMDSAISLWGGQLKLVIRPLARHKNGRTGTAAQSSDRKVRVQMRFNLFQ